MKLLFGVTGSIAAYKAAELARLFVRGGDEVRVAMTEAAQEFITPLTFKTLTRNPVAADQFAEPEEWRPEHISLARWCDVALVAPATADFLAKLRHGLADDILSATLLATRAKIAVAPAMNSGMWENPATRENVAALKARGVFFVGPAEGGLACGDSGPGRMAEPQEIYEAIRAFAAGEPGGKEA